MSHLIAALYYGTNVDFLCLRLNQIFLKAYDLQQKRTLHCVQSQFYGGTTSVFSFIEVIRYFGL